ncbi:DEKNAAC100343 [Brettanomyces naardenensis]|uniref:DEKNAAC100343 n=1 Tax=Brettanomyces naardenensis TaxID=13370 RepID=A0A448YFS9_BRENA|nr:DEKNAAC100343 [Brettanomyces naardenensis]
MTGSNETNPNYPIYQGILSKGWIAGRKVDNTDSQYRFFRDNVFLLFALVGAHCAIRRLVGVFVDVTRTSFDLVFGLFFLFVIHGFNCFKILFHVSVEFLLGRLSSKNRRLSIAFMWIYGVSTLFINDKYRLIKYGDIFGPLSFMDSFKGIVARWDVFFNFTLLRMLSFNLDYVSRKTALTENLEIAPQGQKAKVSNESDGISEKAVPQPPSEEEEIAECLVNERRRLDTPFPISDYSFANYLSYLFYAPLFIGGPIVTFNDYLFQSRHTLPSIQLKLTVVYGLRLIFCILFMEFILHYIYVVAVSKAHAWQGDTPFQISMIGLFNLNIIWLKLLIPWRLFRFWALCDGIDPTENMIRCVDNNYSALQFWRAWHRSYNKWIIRYIYIPLGGSHNRILASLAVFSFVAIWHDIELRLLIWGWLIVLFLLPEIIATKLISPYKDKPWYRFVCGIGAVANIWMMILANLYGFCLGEDGLKQLLDSMFTTLDGFGFFILACICLGIAVQVMFELRESELRRGINLKC